MIYVLGLLNKLCYAVRGTVFGVPKFHLIENEFLSGNFVDTGKVETLKAQYFHNNSIPRREIIEKYFINPVSDPQIDLLCC